MADPTPVFPALQMNTHMPFFDGKYLLFCGSEHVAQREFPNQGDIVRRMLKDRKLREHFARLPLSSPVSYRDWKLYYCSWTTRQPIRLQTGLPQDYIECSPSMYQDGGTIHVSFIAGAFSVGTLNYFLYTMQGDSLDSLSGATPAVPSPTWFGFVSAKYFCVSQGSGIAITEKSTGNKTHLNSSFLRILRVTYRIEDLDTLLITGVGVGGAINTLHYNLRSKNAQEVLSAGPVYKPTIVGDQLIAAVRTGTTVEPYHLVSSSYTLTDSKERVLVA